MDDLVTRLRSKGHLTQGDGLLALLDTGNEAADRITAQAAEIERLREALEGLVDDEPCWKDHHGYCQAHGLNDPCEMAIARQALGAPHAG